MQFIQLLQENITLALFVFGLLGLCVGSFFKCCDSSHTADDGVWLETGV